MNRQTSGMEMRDLADRLLAYEIAATGTEIEGFAACAVFGKLRAPLCALIGVQGFHALLARALKLSTAKVSSLGAVTVEAGGILKGLEELEETEKQGACAVLTTELLTLLSTFVGTDLVRHVLIGEWPEIQLSGARQFGGIENGSSE